MADAIRGFLPCPNPTAIMSSAGAIKTRHISRQHHKIARDRGKIPMPKTIPRAEDVCKRCAPLSRKISDSLRHYKEQRVAWSSNRVADLGSSKSWNPKSCALCCLFLTLNHQHGARVDTKTTYELLTFYFNGRTGFTIKPPAVHINADKDLRRTGYITAMCQADGYDVQLVGSHVKDDFFSSAATLLAERRDAGPRRDSEWIRVHSSSAFRLIDCVTYKIIKAPRECQYAALSYVWGQESEPPSLQGDLLINRLPLVIKDAVAVANRLKIPYLWIDRYCIDQANDSDLADQIMLMDLIYSCALVTIFATAGDGPDHGLPGISNGRDERRQPCAKIGDQLFTWTMPGAAELVSRSKWNTRGWTYQEMVFSASRLIFTDHQLFLELNEDPHGTYSEACDEDLFGADFRFAELGHIPHHKDEGQNTTLARHVAEFSKRKLRNPSDVIKAMQGIFTSMSRQKEAFQYRGMILGGLGIERSEVSQSVLTTSGENLTTSGETLTTSEETVTTSGEDLSHLTTSEEDLSHLTTSEEQSEATSEEQSESTSGEDSPAASSGDSSATSSESSSATSSESSSATSSEDSSATSSEDSSATSGEDSATIREDSTTSLEDSETSGVHSAASGGVSTTSEESSTTSEEQFLIAARGLSNRVARVKTPRGCRRVIQMISSMMAKMREANTETSGTDSTTSTESCEADAETHEADTSTSSTNARSLQMGLLWYTVGKAERRATFPSWSWTGWVGEAKHLLGNDSSYGDPDFHPASIEAFVEATNGSLLSWAELESMVVADCVPEGLLTDTLLLDAYVTWLDCEWLDDPPSKPAEDSVWNDAYYPRGLYVSHHGNSGAIRYSPVRLSSNAKELRKRLSPSPTRVECIILGTLSQPRFRDDDCRDHCGIAIRRLGNGDNLVERIGFVDLTDRIGDGEWEGPLKLEMKRMEIRLV